MKALQEAFESTLKEVRASFSIASRFATSLGAAAGKQLTLVDTLHSVICPEQPSHGVKQDCGEFVECGGRKTTFCSCCQSPKLILHSGPISSLVLPSWSCPTCPVPSQECHTASSVPEGTLSWSTSCFVLSFQHIQLAEVPGSHFVHLNEPEVVSGIISNFLTAQNTRARL